MKTAELKPCPICSEMHEPVKVGPWEMLPCPEMSENDPPIYINLSKIRHLLKEK